MVLRGDAEVEEEGLHAGPQRGVVAVDPVGDACLLVGPGVTTESSEDGDDHLVAQHAEAGNDAGGALRHDVAPGTGRLVHEMLAPELAQVVGGLADAVAVLPKPFRRVTKPRPSSCVPQAVVPTRFQSGVLDGPPASAHRRAGHGAYRQRRRQPRDLVVDVALGSTSSKGRTQGRVWMVRLRRDAESVIVAIGLSRGSAEALAERITELL